MVVRRLDEYEAENDQGSVGVQKFSEKCLVGAHENFAVLSPKIGKCLLNK